MAATIRPNRLEVSDRFPMLGFTIRTDSPPRQAEVVLATDPALFSAKEGRNAGNFYSSREHGLLSLPRGEAVYVVPPEVLSRFVAANRLWFGLATAASPSTVGWTVDVLPTTASPYISLSALTDRSLRRIRMFPPRRPMSGYGGNTSRPGATLDWAGDIAAPGTMPAINMPVANVPTTGPTPSAVPYDDGFGPLPPVVPSDPVAVAIAPANTGGGEGLPTVQSQNWYAARGMNVDPENMGIDGPAYSDGDNAPATASALNLTAADYPRTARIAASPAFTSGRRGQAIDRIVIHITDAPTTSSTVNHFSRADANSSAHYLVGQDGEIVQFVNECDTAWHARGANSRSIGIEHVAVKQGGVTYGRQTFPHLPPTDTQYCESAALVSYLCEKYGLTPDRNTIIGHREADTNTSHTSCPDGAWNWAHFMDLVTNQYCAPQQASSQGFGASAEVDPEQFGIDGPLHDVGPVQQPTTSSALALTTADYAGVTRVRPSPNFSRGRGRSVIDRIVIHITDSPPSPYRGDQFLESSARKSAHYMIDETGAIQQFVAEADTAWHARGGNRRSIGIEHVAVKQGGATYGRSHFPYEPPTEAEYLASAELVAHLCLKYGLPADRTAIVGHKEIDIGTTHSSCPDGAWDWSHYMPLVEACYARLSVAGNGAATQALGRYQGQNAATSRGLSGGGDTIEIKYRMFIPSPAISGPFFDNYHGDGRGFSYSSGTSRGEITVLADVSAGGGVSNLRVADRHWSQSHSYSASDTSAAAGKPDWWLNLNSGAVPTGSAGYAATDDNLRASIGAPGTTRNVQATLENASIISIYASANNALVTGSPAIDADVSVMVRRTSDGGIEVKACGSHDGFPAHELYVNGQAVHQYDPEAAGNGPTALMPPEDIDVNTEWQGISLMASGMAFAANATMHSATVRDPEDGEISGPVHDVEPPAVQTASAFELTDAEYPGARVMLSPAFTRGRSGQTIDRIVIHITSSRQSPHLGTWFTRADANSSAHYMVDQEGIVRQFVSEADTSWHAGNRAMNRRSIGIEHVAVEQGGAVYGNTTFPYTPPTDVEYAVSAQLVAHLCRKYGLTPDRTTIIGHSEANPRTTHTSCPNGAWDWDRYMGMVSLAFAAAPIVEAISPVVNTIRNAIGLSGESWTINWDDVEQIPQPTDMGCWATAAAMLVGWRDWVCVDPTMIARFTGCEPSLTDGLTAAKKRAFASAVGLVVHPNACYTPEGFREIIEANGPVWVTTQTGSPSFIHAVVATGMYRSGDDYFVRITDPLDRVVGSPGTPGARTSPPTHMTGSRYIMSWNDFAAEFEAAGNIDRIQLLHTGGTHRHTINRGDASGAGYAQSLNNEAVVSPSISAVGPAADERFGIGTALTRTNSTLNGRQYDLAQLSGMVSPSNALAGGAGLQPLPGERVSLTDWPYIDGPSGRTKAGVGIDWQYNGAAVGQIVIQSVEGQALDGWTVTVVADILPNGSTPDMTHLKVRVTTTFCKVGEEDQVAVSEVILMGSGKHQLRHGADRVPLESPPSAPAAVSPSPAVPAMA